MVDGTGAAVKLGALKVPVMAGVLLARLLCRDMVD